MSTPAADTPYVAPHLAHWPKRLPRELAIPQTPLHINLDVSALRWPDKAAYVFLGRPVTFAELQEQAGHIAGWLQAQGVKKGDRVIVFLQNCPQFVAAVHGILRADAVVVPVNPMNKADEFGHYITDPQAAFAITSHDLAGIVHEADSRLPAGQRLRRVIVTRISEAGPEGLGQAIDPAEAPAPAILEWLRFERTLPDDRFVRWADVLSAAYRPGPSTAQADDLAVMPYTSGTTGLPKGCLHTHRTLMANVAGGGIWSLASPESVSLAVVPMFHITGFVYSVLGGIYVGSTAVLLPRWDRELAARLIARHRVTHWTCIPTMIIDLLASPNVASFDLRSLRYLSGGGAAMPHAVAERLQRDFGLTFAEGYGLTETAAPSHANPPERAKLQCLGMPIFGVDSRIVSPDSLQVLPPGQTGEIVTRGPMVFKGYWGHAEATAAAFIEIDGQRFFRTGDLGMMDEEGYFFITDRLKRMINASGFKVWPSEVELLLFKCPLVQEACVIATRDDYRGESVKAVIVLRDAVRQSARPQDIIDWAREHMAAYKVPRSVEFVEALPKSGSGKVMWRLLQEREAAKGSAA
jgi:fatty-acyl-CoA synthase